MKSVDFSSLQPVLVLTFIIGITAISIGGCCLMDHALRSKRELVPTKTEIAQLVEQILETSPSKENLINFLEENGFFVSERSPELLWASIEFESTFPTSIVFDVFIEKSNGKYICREIRSSGKGL